MDASPASNRCATSIIRSERVKQKYTRRATLSLPRALTRHTSLLTYRWLVNPRSARLEKPGQSPSGPHHTRHLSVHPQTPTHDSHRTPRQRALLEVRKARKCIRPSTHTCLQLDLSYTGPYAGTDKGDRLAEGLSNPDVDRRHHMFVSEPFGAIGRCISILVLLFTYGPLHTRL